MKNVYTGIFATLFVAMTVMGCGPSAEEKKAEHEKADAHKVAQITWRDVAFIDTIQQGDTVVRNYVFYNTGWKPVVIKHALPNRPECTCKIPTREVPIGEQDTVQLRCIFPDFETKASVEIVIEHNTPQPDPLLVYMGYMLRE